MDLSRTPTKSWVWEYFQRVAGTDRALCTICGTLICYKGSSTSAMGKHLRKVHGMSDNVAEVNPRKAVKRRAPPSFLTSEAAGRNLETIISKLAAEDNVPFKTIAESPTLRLLISTYLDKDVPRSPNIIKLIVLKKAEDCRQHIRKQLATYQLGRGTFAIAFDEASVSNSPHRYINVNLRTEADEEAGVDFCLGLVKIDGKATAGAVADGVRGRLHDFDVSLRNCYFAVTDGAAVMKNAAEKLNLQSQPCLVHALHLALVRVLGKSADPSASHHHINTSICGEDDNSEDSYDSSSSEDENDNEGILTPVLYMQVDTSEKIRQVGGFCGDASETQGSDEENSDQVSIAGSRYEIPVTDREQPEFTVVKTAIANLRKVLTGIKRSGPKRDRLGEITREQHGMSLRVILDTKILWYSTITMLERALLIMPSINLLLDEFDEEPFSEQAKIELMNIREVLIPFKTAMKLLCSSKATLAHGDRTILALLDCLRSNVSSLSVALQTAVIEEVRKRRTRFSSLLQYLLDPSYDSRVERALGMSAVSDADLQHSISEILSRDSEEADFVDSILDEEAGEAEEEPQPGTASSFAFGFVDVFRIPLRPRRAPSQSEATSEKIVREMKLHEAGQGLGRFLKLCTRRLLTIPPTSVKPERDFSIMNSVCPKTRISLGPKTLDSLVLLRAWYHGVSQEEEQ